MEPRGLRTKSFVIMTEEAPKHLCYMWVWSWFVLTLWFTIHYFWTFTWKFLSYLSINLPLTFFPFKCLCSSSNSLLFRWNGHRIILNGTFYKCLLYICRHNYEVNWSNIHKHICRNVHISRSECSKFLKSLW